MKPTSSGWENYAYHTDSTADNGFSVDTSCLKKDTIYYISYDLFTDADFDRLAFSLQGLINREFDPEGKSTSLLFIEKDISDPAWFKYSTEKGTTFDFMKKKVIKSVEEFYEIFMPVIRQCGIVLWDAFVPATANLALTVCGLDGFIPVMAGSALEKELTDKGVEVKLSFVGKFDGSETGSAKNDVYRFGLREYFPRCSSHYLAYILDGAPCSPESDFSKISHKENNCLSNHDYIIARRCFAFDLLPFDGVTPCDDKDQPLGTDYETMKMIFAARFKRDNGNIGQLLGFPPWWLKYTREVTMPDGSRGNELHAVWVEWAFTETISCYNLAKEADAYQPCCMSNGSFFYKYRMRTEKFINNKSTEDIKFDKNVLYFTIYGGDYDSSAWMKDKVFKFFVNNDPARGKVEIMWNFNPNLSWRIPMAFDYIYSHKTDKDRFEAGDSGAGYIMPSGLFAGETMKYTNLTRPAENGDATELWAEYSKKFYDIFDYDITGFIINGANGFDERVMDLFNKISPAGSMFDWGERRLDVYKGVPYVGCYNEVNMGRIQDMYRYCNDGDENNNFAAFRTIIQSPSQIKEIVDEFTKWSKKHGKTVRYVDTHTFFKLIKESGQGRIIE